MIIFFPKLKKGKVICRGLHFKLRFKSVEIVGDSFDEDSLDEDSLDDHDYLGLTKRDSLEKFPIKNFRNKETLVAQNAWYRGRVAVRERPHEITLILKHETLISCKSFSRF